MTAHEFTISVSQLDAGGREYEFPVRAAWLRGVLEGCDGTAAGPDGHLSIRASKSGNDVIVHGDLKAELALQCARCLDPVPMHFKGPVSALAVPASTLAAGMKHGKRGDDDDDGEEIGEGEADVMPYEGDLVVLDDLVRDTIVLEIPMIPLCSEDCPGMSPPPGINAAAEAGIDPRLAPLLRLKKMSETDPNAPVAQGRKKKE